MKNFRLRGADVEISYHDNKLHILMPGGDERTFPDDSIENSHSDIGEQMTVAFLTTGTAPAPSCTS